MITLQGLKQLYERSLKGGKLPKGYRKDVQAYIRQKRRILQEVYGSGAFENRRMFEDAKAQLEQAELIARRLLAKGEP